MTDYEELELATKNWTALASDVFKRPFNNPRVDTSLRGRCAGRADFWGWRIKYNMELYQRHKEEFINRTVPHELAHLIASTLYPRCSAHGGEWRSVMHKLGVEDVTRCHSYDTSGLTHTMPEPYIYKCNCRTYTFTRIRHRKAKEGTTYRCTRCRSHLEYSHMKI